MAYVRVAVPLPVHGLFTYAVPPQVAALRLPVGAEVRVPFGGRATNGWVVEWMDTSRKGSMKGLSVSVPRERTP